MTKDERKTGTVAKWLNHKGIGFITPEGQESVEGKDILVHFSEIKQESEDGFKSLNEGSTVTYILTVDPKNADKHVATEVTGPDGADCAPRQKGRGKGKGRNSKGSGKGRKGKGKGKRDSGSDEEEE